MKFFCLITCLLAGSLDAQTIVQSFDGDAGTTVSAGVPTYRDHPDANIASNGYQLVQSDGQNVNVYTYSGTLVKSTATTTFVTNAGVTLGVMQDPRLVYDPFIDRFIMGCSCSSDFMIVSSTSDATGTWKGVALGANSGDLTMRIGYDKNGVYITEYQGDSLHYIVLALPNADVIANPPVITHLNTFLNQNWELNPSVDLNTAKGATDPAYFMSRDGPNQNGTNVSFNLLVNALTWSGTTASLGSNITIAAGYLYNTPITESQPNTPQVKGTESHRFGSVTAINGHLHTVMATGPCASTCGTQGVDTHNIILWFDINMNNSTLTQSAKVSSSTLGYIFPSFAMDQLGNDVFCATSTGSAQNASVDCWTHLATDASGTINGPTRVVTGIAVNSVCNATNPTGWGTYSATVYDPNNPYRVWTVQEYANSATACLWATRLAQLQMIPQPLPGPSAILAALTQ